MLPVYAMYLLGGTDAAPGRLRVLRRCLGLLCGFVLLFTLMGAGAGALGSLLKNADRGTLDIVTGVLMLLFGVWMLDVIHIHLPAVPGLGGRQPSMNGFVGSFLFGLLIAISWTPCLTPVLANALVLAASADNATMWTGIVSLAVFALGLSLPIGISFYTFQTMSYTIDVYRQDARAQKNIISFGTYVTLFHQ